MNKKEEPLTYYHIRVEPRTIATLTRFAASIKPRPSKSAVVRAALDEYFARHGEAANAP